MLAPSTLARLSLTEEAPKEVFLVDIPVSVKGNVGVPFARRARFESAGRLSYGSIRSLIDDQDSPLRQALLDASALADTLQATRVAGGALAMRSLGTLHSTDEEGRIVTIPAGAHVGMRIVQELMILANAGLAAICDQAELPILYRNHVVGSSAQRREIGGLLDTSFANGAAIGPMSGRIDHLVGRARLGARTAGHWALNLADYAWFTSPIRRYADIVNQRMLASSWTEVSRPTTSGSLRRSRSGSTPSTSAHGRKGEAS